jgi:uncharacterized protein (DUF1778 family)
MGIPSEHRWCARIVTTSASAALVLAARLQGRGIPAFIAPESASLTFGDSCVRAAVVLLPSAAFDAALELLAEPRVDDGELEAAAMAEPRADDAYATSTPPLSGRLLVLLASALLLLVILWQQR